MKNLIKQYTSTNKQKKHNHLQIMDSMLKMRKEDAWWPPRINVKMQ